MGQTKKVIKTAPLSSNLSSPTTFLAPNIIIITIVKKNYNLENILGVIPQVLPPPPNFFKITISDVSILQTSQFFFHLYPFLRTPKNFSSVLFT